MLDNDNICKELAETVKDYLEEEESPLQSKRYEHLFISMVRNQKQRQLHKKRIKTGLFYASIAAAAAIIISLSIILAPKELPFTVVSSSYTFQGAPGNWIETGETLTKEIKFKQGTLFELGPNCGARIIDAHEKTVTIELTQGEIHAKVKGNSKTQWKINAGPFTVSVLGTTFNVSWNTTSSQLSVSVEEGAVLVQGAGLNKHGMRLQEQQQLLANGRSGEILLKSLAEIDSASGKDSSEMELLPNLNSDKDSESIASDYPHSDAENKTTEKSPDRQINTRNNVKTTWQELYKKGLFSDALIAAEKRGLQSIYQTADAQSLWNLADAARNAQKVTISNNALLALRQRHGHENKARLAAFILGRQAMDLSKNPQIAAKWFQTYLNESPRGSMAQEVHERLITIYLQINQTDRAKQIARQYLNQYPQGIYAQRARQVLQP